ncbi:MAG: hypothetical protein IPH07_34335 [Deltaproteobacteria bacterium]|nr:hypothetical protein [Deltaproteobacteria bacterium]MBK8716422.1 hypothetical protein [Deltaproteobacteria bacterium]MBP7287858.1 hypothetical protein [Nannocystaceae bacterium]
MHGDQRGCAGCPSIDELDLARDTIGGDRPRALTQAIDQQALLDDGAFFTDRSMDLAGSAMLEQPLSAAERARPRSDPDSVIPVLASAVVGLRGAVLLPRAVLAPVAVVALLDRDTVASEDRRWPVLCAIRPHTPDAR